MKNAFSLLVVLISGMGIAAAQDSAPAAEAKVVTIGIIGKIDAKAKSVTLNFTTSLAIEPPAEAHDGTSRGGASGGGSRGGGRGGGRGDGGRGGGSRQSSGTSSSTSSGGNSGGRAAPALSNCKVMVSSTTVLKEGDKEIRFADLKVGDTLQVMSAKGGAKFDALEITRSPKEGPDSQ